MRKSPKATHPQHKVHKNKIGSLLPYQEKPKETRGYDFCVNSCVFISRNWIQEKSSTSSEDLKKAKVRETKMMATAVETDLMSSITLGAFKHV